MPVGFGEIASGDDRHAQRAEESRRDRAEPRTRIFLTVHLRVPLDRELEARTERAGVAPRHDRADRDALDAGEIRDAADDLLVEAGDLFGFAFE